MTEPRSLPGDPSDLCLRISYADDLADTPRADTLEHWFVDIVHRRREHDADQCTAPPSCSAEDCPAYARAEGSVGSMDFYRVRLDRGMNAHAALAEESEDLCEFAQVMLDPVTGNFTAEASELLDYAGSDLLVMDRVTLTDDWRGHGLGVLLAIEAICRLMPGCRAVVCQPGISDVNEERRLDQAEWDRVTGKITKGWERIGFRHYRDKVYVLSPVSLVLEEQQAQLRAEFAELAASWRRASLRQ